MAVEESAMFVVAPIITAKFLYGVLASGFSRKLSRYGGEIN
jgi:hypothetical protein